MVTKDIQYIGVDDKTLDLFEGQYVVPHGVSYNSYVILDEKVAVMDTVDHRKTAEYLANLEKALCGRKPDYLVISHLEPDHASSIQAFVEKYPEVRLVGNAKTFHSMEENFDFDASSIISEGHAVDEVGQRLLDLIVRVASGELTAAERFGGTELFCVGRRHGYRRKSREELWAGHGHSCPM